MEIDLNFKEIPAERLRSRVYVFGGDRESRSQFTGLRDFGDLRAESDSKTTISLSSGRIEKMEPGCKTQPLRMEPNKKRFVSLMAPVLLSLSMSAAGDAIDYLSVPGPIGINQLSYNLAWSSHPKDNFYIQEYVPAGETPEHYSNMVLLQVFIGSKSAKEVVGALAKSIEEQGKTDPLVHYELFQSAAGKDEYLIDFLQSKGPAAEVVEWNAYRYKTFSDKSGRTGILLFGISRRAHGEQVHPFLIGLKTERIKLRNGLNAHPFPDISIKQ